MEKVGNIIDDYKLVQFEIELRKLGFDKWEIKKYSDGITTLIIEVPKDRVKDVGKAMSKTNKHFLNQQSN